jgi:hypothetical protein
MRLLVVAVVSVLLLPTTTGQNRIGVNPQYVVESPAVYSPNPNHIWNQVYDVLLVREDKAGGDFGVDSLDPLLWWKTKHLLEGPSHEQALMVLDEFLRTHAENEIRDPIKRVLLKRDLWAVFDWSASSTDDHLTQRRELQVRLAEVMRRLALTSDEIKSLPETYTQALASGAFATEYDPAHKERTFLPADLFQPTGPWVYLWGNGVVPVAEEHTAAVSGRSRFLVFLRLPGGRKATLDYLRTLWEFPEPWSAHPGDPNQVVPSTKLPQFPAGTQVALVRQMITFDRSGELVPTPITENVQIRVYHSVPARIDHNDVNVDWSAARSEQDRYELRLSRRKLFAREAGGLRALGPDEKEFLTFKSQGEDPFVEPRSLQQFRSRVLDGCVACHSAPGINSLQSRIHLLKPNPLQRDPDKPESEASPLWWGADEVVWWKQQHHDWGLLNGYWNAARGANASGLR